MVVVGVARVARRLTRGVFTGMPSPHHSSECVELAHLRVQQLRIQLRLNRDVMDALLRYEYEMESLMRDFERGVLRPPQPVNDQANPVTPPHEESN
jgi:hypothetical protein